jgi:hypothetical protein
MRKRTRLLISTAVLVMVIGAIFLAVKPELSSAQDAEFRSYQLVVYCGNSGVATVIFGHEVTSGGTVGRPLMGNKSICAGNCPGGTGTVPLAAALAGLPAQVSAALQAKVDKHQADAAAGKGRPLTCLQDGKENPKCEPPRDLNNNPPWLNQDVPCQDRQQATYSWGQRNRNRLSVSISICGQVIRYVTPPQTITPITPVGLSKYDVCCDNWQNAVSTSSPCNAKRDIDCDGKLNENDVNPFRAPSKEGSSEDFVSNPPLTPTLPFWRQVYESIPEQSDCKDCKWELVGIQYTCKDEVERTGRRSESRNAEYRYQATWKCPANGSTTVTNDYATMKGSEQRRGSPCCRCPSPPSGSWP